MSSMEPNREDKNFSGKKPYYNTIFQNKLDKHWENAPGKDVIVNAANAHYKKETISRNALVVDIGCGTGFLLNRASIEICSSWNLYGVDFSPTAIEEGKRRYPYLNLFCEDGSQTHFLDGIFDVLISYGSFEHFDNPESGIMEAGRILKGGGIFFIMLPTLGVYRTDRDDEGWYKELEIKGSPICQMQWNLRRNTWHEFFRNAGLKLYDIALSKKYGAKKLGVFYFGVKNQNYQNQKRE